MATKTWKLGEVSRGGIITVEATSKQVTIIGKEWDFSKGSRRSSDQSNAKEFTRETVNVDSSSAYRTLDNFLCDLTTSYYAGQILDWVKTKTKLGNGYNW
jgi:hypothetical protein